MLKVNNLSCGYGDKKIISGVSFSVEQGDFVGILGPNGAGKTTLFRAATGIIPPWEGEVFYKDANILNIPRRKFAKEVAVIPQLVETPFDFTVDEFVFLGRFPHLSRFQAAGAVDQEAVLKAMQLTDTIDLRQRKIFELSGGERQRVLLAQGFAQSPRFLFLDEPTAHLDIAHQVAVMDILDNLNRKHGLTVVIILHDLNLASEYCKRLILLDNGKIFREGVSDDILTYQNIEKVYKTAVVVEKNPVSGKPYLLLVSEKELKKSEKRIKNN